MSTCFGFWRNCTPCEEEGPLSPCFDCASLPATLYTTIDGIVTDLELTFYDPHPFYGVPMYVGDKDGVTVVIYCDEGLSQMQYAYIGSGCEGGFTYDSCSPVEFTGAVTMGRAFVFGSSCPGSVVLDVEIYE